MFTKSVNLVKPTSNMAEVSLGWLTVWFSYSTPVAFRVDGSPLVIARNQWGKATERHLNLIDSGKSRRVPHAELLELLEALIPLRNMAEW